MGGTYTVYRRDVGPMWSQAYVGGTMAAASSASGFNGTTTDYETTFFDRP